MAASLVDYIESSASRFPRNTAIVDPTGREITYQDLDEQASRLAGFLQSVGVQPGDRVGVILPKGIAAIVAFVGIMKVRAAYVPADHTAPAARNRTILEDCQVRVAILVPDGLGMLEGWTASLPAAVVVVGTALPNAAPVPVVSWAGALDYAPVHVGGRDAADLAYILYTSGSTGVPKGVMITQSNALSFVDWCSDTFSPSELDRFSSHAPFHFDLSILDIYVSLKHGAPLFVVSEELGKTPKELARFIASVRLTVWYSTPSILSLLAQFGDLPSSDYSALRLVLFAGEVFPVKHLRNLATLWPKASFYNLYGPTETNVCTFAHVPTPVPEERLEPYPIGFACAHCEPLVLDHAGRAVGTGEEGLLYIAGASVFAGYWNRPEQNASGFLHRDGLRWYNTGDVVRFVNGQGYYYVGRRDRMVKRHGYRIELGEIERGLYQHPDVAEAAVIAVPDDGASVRILAYLSARGLQRPSIIDLKMFCAKHLPAYMVPDAFVYLDALPRTSTDKIDYQGLTRMAAPVSRTGDA